MAHVIFGEYSYATSLENLPDPRTMALCDLRNWMIMTKNISNRLLVQDMLISIFEIEFTSPRQLDDLCLAPEEFGAEIILDEIWPFVEDDYRHLHAKVQESFLSGEITTWGPTDLVWRNYIDLLLVKTVNPVTHRGFPGNYICCAHGCR